MPRRYIGWRLLICMQQYKNLLMCSGDRREYM